MGFLLLEPRASSLRHQIPSTAMTGTRLCMSGLGYTQGVQGVHYGG